MRACAWTLVVSLAAASTSQAQTIPIQPGSITARLQPYATIPTATDSAPQDFAIDGSGRHFISTRGGKIRVLDTAGNFLDSAASPYFSLASQGVSLFTDGEGGFAGLAFSPNFATDRKFFTLQTETYNASNAVNFSHPEIAPTTGMAAADHLTVREWTVNNAASNAPSITSSGLLMRVNMPQSNHQGGGLRFGPDNNLYISIGDGGGSNDRNGAASNNTDGHTNATGNAQDLTVAYGKILRVTPNFSGGYTVPASNPFAGATPGLDEIYAYGLRNPYRMNFDKGGTQQLYVGDVGQDAREEVDIITSGGNYGWVFREGTTNNSNSDRTTPGGFTSINPVAEYAHPDGNSVIGGFVYRGTAVPALTGKYIFGDYQGNAGVGRIFYSDSTGGTISQLQFDTTNGGLTPASALYGFGQGADGTLYVMFVNGTVARLVPEPTAVLALAPAAAMLMRRRRSR